MDKCCVYSLSNDDGRPRYVGMTCGEVRVRLRNHRRMARNGTRRPVYDWMRKYGPDSIYATVLEVVDPDRLYEVEQAWIARLRSEGADLLNLVDGGPGRSGIKMTAEQVDAMRLRPVSDETRARMSVAAKGRPSPNKGKPMSEEQKAKQREAMRGRTASAETRAKMSAAAKGRAKSPEHAAKIGAAVRAAAERRRAARGG